MSLYFLTNCFEKTVKFGESHYNLPKKYIDREHPELIHQTMVAITRRYVSQFYCFNCDTYLQVKSGIGVLLVSHTAEAADVQEFAMNRLIHIKPNIYFAVVSTTQKLE